MGALFRYTVETFLTDTLVLSGQLYLRTPSQNSVFLNSHINSVYKIPVSDGHLLSSWGCPLIRVSTVYPLDYAAYSNYDKFVKLTPIHDEPKYRLSH